MVSILKEGKKYFTSKTDYLNKLMFNLHLTKTSLKFSSACNRMHWSMASLCVNHNLYSLETYLLNSNLPIKSQYRRFSSR